MAVSENIAGSSFGKGFAAVVTGAVAIGTAAIFMRLSDVSPTAAAFWRMALSLPLLYIWMRLEKHNGQKEGAADANQDTLKAMVIVGFWFAADLFLWHWSVDITTVANATLLANMATIFTAIAGFLFFGQRFSKTFLGGMGLALLGAVALVGQNASVNPDYFFGDMLGLATAVAYAGYIVAAARFRGHISTATLMFGSGLVTALFLLPAALLESGNFFPASVEGWLPLIGLAWIAHVGGQSLIIYGLAHVPATLGSVTLLIQPVVSAVLAWWLFAEVLGLGHLIGALLVLMGVAIAKKGSSSGSPQAAE